MALAKCLDCGKEIADTAPKCPHCGSLDTPSNMRQRRHFTNAPLMVLGALVLLVLFFRALTWLIS
jgi:ABC-type ATPase with predicted acetyltransferase domain